jgi:hypothetical protein
VINNLKQCKKCNYFKELNAFYAQKKISKSKGEYIYYDSVCKECRIENQSENYLDNKETVSEYKKDWYAKNETKVKTRRKERYKENPEYDREYLKEWHIENPDKVKGYNEKRQHKNHKISDLEWFYCLAYFANNCAYCGMSWEEQYSTNKKDLNMEHIDDEGKNDLTNCVPSCTHCNSEKNVKTLDEWFNKDNYKYTELREFRIHNWINHDCFRFLDSK